MINNWRIQDCFQKLELVEGKVETIQKKISNLQNTSSLLKKEMNDIRESQEKALMTINAFHHMYTEGIISSSQNSQPPSVVEINSVECTGDSWQENTWSEVELEDMIQDNTCNIVCNGHNSFPANQAFDLNFKEEGTCYELTRNQANESILSSTGDDIINTVLYKEEICPVEIDVQCLSLDIDENICSHESEPNKCVIVSSPKQTVKVVDTLKSLPQSVGSGEHEETPHEETHHEVTQLEEVCKMGHIRRIPHYQGLRKTTDIKSKVVKEQEGVEDKINQSKATELQTSDSPKSSKNNTPRNYSSIPSAEIAEITTANARRRKQKNYRSK